MTNRSYEWIDEPTPFAPLEEMESFLAYVRSLPDNVSNKQGLVEYGERIIKEKRQFEEEMAKEGSLTSPND